MTGLEGDMVGPFYMDVGPSGCERARKRAGAWLDSGEPPGESLTGCEGEDFDLEQYREAVARHRSGRLHDAELAGFALLLRLLASAKGKRRALVLEPVGNAESERLVERFGPLADWPPFLRLFARHRLRGIKAMAHEALIGWGRGIYPGMLAIGKVTPLELLLAQARGQRQVGIGLPLAGFDAVDAGYPGGFIHHDLCHLAKFRGDPAGNGRIMAGQVGFFRALAPLVAAEPELLGAAADGRPWPIGMDLTVVVADTNGDVRLLITLFLARILARRGIPTGPDAQSVISAYLMRIGLAHGSAAKAAELWSQQRAAALGLIGEHFEQSGRADGP